MGLRDIILAADDRKRTLLDVPEWDGVRITLRSMTAAQNEAYVTRVIQEKRTDARELLISLTACNDDGTLIFSEDDVKKLGEKDDQVIQRVFEAAQAVNGLGKKPSQAKEEAKKN
jgi:hypothetical protein